MINKKEQFETKSNLQIKPTMLSKDIENSLNQQVALQSHASTLYLGMAVWCDYHFLEASAYYLQHQANAKWERMINIFNFIADKGGVPYTPNVQQIPNQFHSLKALFDQIHLQEEQITVALQHLIEDCRRCNCYEVYEFLDVIQSDQLADEAQLKIIRLQVEKHLPNWFSFDQKIAQLNVAGSGAEAISD